MASFYLPTLSADDWQRGLVDPDKQWRTGYSARALAHCWESACGLPAEICELFAQSSYAPFEQVEMLLGLPEHEVRLDGQGHGSQNDLFVLARDAAGGLISLMVEGKVDEPPGPKLDQWLVNASANKHRRLAFLQKMLGLDADLPGQIRYQLLHRTASAVIEAQRFNAASAVMVVHSFSQTGDWFDDFAQFVGLYDVSAAADGSLRPLTEIGGVRLFAGWATGDPAFLAR